MKGFEKWDQHDVGDVEWIRKHKTHPHRNHFIDYAIANDSITSILEIGGGELMEAKVIIKKNDNIRYTVADVSSSFLKHAVFILICDIPLNLLHKSILNT